MSDKILVVEDEIHICRLLRMVFEKRGFSVDICSSGEQCLQYLNDNPTPGVMILDIMMPGIDGLQVLRTIRGDSRHKDVPVIMLTALAQENVVKEGIKLGVSDYLRKPFNPNDLLDRVSGLLSS